MVEPLRLKQAMSQRKLADAASISQRAIVNFETTEESSIPPHWKSSLALLASSPQSS